MTYDINDNLYISLYQKWNIFKLDFHINIKILFFSFHKSNYDIIPFLSSNEILIVL